MKIISVSGRKPNDPAVVYCGRGTRNGWKGTPLGNPFVTRSNWADLYRTWLRSKIEANDPATLAALAAIKPDSLLGCWCINIDAADVRAADDLKKCHCEIIVEEWVRLYGPVAPHADVPTPPALPDPVDEMFGPGGNRLAVQRKLFE